MKIGICDDNIEELNNIREICHNIGYANTISFSCGKDILEYKGPSWDLLFLDIEMGGINGIELKNHFEHSNAATLIAFTTSHTEHMPDAFGRNVISFLPKPCSEHSVKMCIERASYILRDVYNIHTDDNITLISRDVLYMQAEQKYTIIYTTDGQAYHSRKSITQWSKELEHIGYCQISRAIIVNLLHYESMYNNEIRLVGGTILRISRRYLQQALNKIKLSKGLLR